MSFLPEFLLPDWRKLPVPDKNFGMSKDVLASAEISKNFFLDILFMLTELIMGKTH